MNRCPHRNVQQFTEVCLDCGRNIYESDEEYLRYLKQREAEQDSRMRSALMNKEILELEANP